jgi:dTDP-4-amino-4,6-dideoxygalactose transaminase
MNITFVDLRKQYLSIREEIDSAISTVIDESAFVGGSYVKKFESDFASYLQMQYVIGCANGTDSLEMILKAYGISAGDEVIVPAISWISTAEVVNSVGATPVFADILPDLYTISPVEIEKKITSRTKAIIPVHLYGLPAEMNEIMALAGRYHLKVIEDCAQSHGAIYKNKMVGTIGDCASFSFYPGKNLGAYGDAGCVATNDGDLADKVRVIANHGQRKKNDHVSIGRNSRLDGLQAAILSVKLKHLEKWTSERIANACLYESLVTSAKIHKPLVPSYSRHVYHLYVIRTKERGQLQRKLDQKNISYGIHYPTALPFLPPYNTEGNNVAEDFPVASVYQNETLSIPMFAELTKEEIEYIADVLNEGSC